METGVTMRMTSSNGFSLVETVIALGVLTTGVLGAAAVLATGMQNLGSSPSDVVVTQKAAEAVEAVFSARDSGRLTWAQIQNYSAGGIFTDGPKQLRRPGPDGVVNTIDDDSEPIETAVLPGKDQKLGTADDQTITLTNFTREIKLTDVPGSKGELRSIVVTIKYQNGPTLRTYVLTSFISAYS
jgi:type II secretory pathway pseudopilin PulG